MVLLVEAIFHGERSGVVLLKSFSVPVSYIASGHRIGWVTNVLAPCSVIGGLQWDGTGNAPHGFSCWGFDGVHDSSAAR